MKEKIDERRAVRIGPNMIKLIEKVKERFNEEMGFIPDTIDILERIAKKADDFGLFEPVNRITVRNSQ